MKKIFSITIYTLIFLFLTSTIIGCANAQNKKYEMPEAIKANPDNMEAHLAYLDTIESADEVEDQYKQWIKEYPESSTIPLAIANKYGTYSPKAKEYYLEAAERAPENGEIWSRLSLDASLRGDTAKELEYMEKAVSVDSDNLEFQQNYIGIYKRIDPKIYREKSLEFAQKYPEDPATHFVLHILGLETEDQQERIAIYEQIRRMFPKADNPVPFTRLVNEYIKTGQYSKAIELAEEWAKPDNDRLLFTKKLEVSKKLLDIENKMAKGHYKEAEKVVKTIEPPSSHLFNIGSHIKLIEADLMKKTGEVRKAYEHLIAVQADFPYYEVKDVLEKYGAELNKTPEEVNSDILALIAKNSKPAPDFKLEQYGKDKSFSLQNLKGKTILMSYWYPACGPCRGEMPHIEKVIKNTGDNLVYLGVNGYREQDSFVLPFMAGTKYSFIPLKGEEEVIKEYGVQHYPTNFLIDKKGRIAYSDFMVGADDWKSIKLMIEILSKQKG
jgi:tetratricopeptide (TPR) repeat protein